MKHPHYLLQVIISVFLIFGKSCFAPSPSWAAERLTLRYGPFERSVAVSDLQQYAQTRKASPALKALLQYLSVKDQFKVQEALQLRLPLDLVSLDRLLYTPIGQTVLNRVSAVVVRRDQAGVPALRAAVVLGDESPGGLSLISFLAAYPSSRLVVDIPKAIALLGSNDFYPSSEQVPPKDTLASTALWQLEVQYQQLASQGKQYAACLFGDSITAELGNRLGDQVFNFALDGLSSLSLVEQLKLLTPAHIQCRKAVIAIGGNDAWYELSDELFIKKLKDAIALVRQLGTPTIFLIPAFYSTVAASQDPSLAAPLERVDQINQLINQVAVDEKLPVVAAGIQSLYERGNVLKANLTTDGDHLNAAGLAIYQQALLQLLKSQSSPQ